MLLPTSTYCGSVVISFTTCKNIDIATMVRFLGQCVLRIKFSHFTLDFSRRQHGRSEPSSVQQVAEVGGWQRAKSSISWSGLFSFRAEVKVTCQDLKKDKIFIYALINISDLFNKLNIPIFKWGISYFELRSIQLLNKHKRKKN